MEQTIEKLIKERDSFYKRGLELSQRKCQSDDTSDICQAFALAQKEFAPVKKNTKGYNYKYAQLDQILDMVRPVLSKHGLSISQYTDRDNILYTRLSHASGQWFHSEVAITVAAGDNKRSLEQSWGSSVTYMRRYQILSVLGLHPTGEDNDGAR
jgi:hypothetical protein